ncbi:hypothetical protein [Paraurantiacibacter namhicola]|uniref:Lipoprotein n=1 Tax=Paraurantiacibacter namhicola TaxID=645517 RepID=A0A1C7D9R7_9SPHN|nr:hypothetical protein [Paraurantiacibacter namhicola]ANU08112.1 hypothetical protein A6F65_01817 [Paraurantiacibacter namhicola]
MKKLILIAAAPLALAACGGSDEEATTEDTMAADNSTVATTDTYVTGNTMGDGGAMAGTYTTTASDGTTSTETINADGTYSVSNEAGEEVVSGTVATQNGQVCYTPEGETASLCYNQTQAGPDGTWETVSQTGERYTVTRN